MCGEATELEEQQRQSASIIEIHPCVFVCVQEKASVKELEQGCSSLSLISLPPLEAAL